MGFGNADDGYDSRINKYIHDSRTVTSFGGGLDYQATKRVWVRADYEYQTWPSFFKHTNPAIRPGRLNPQGFTVGAMYHF